MCFVEAISYVQHVIAIFVLVPAWMEKHWNENLYKLHTTTINLQCSTDVPLPHKSWLTELADEFVGIEERRIAVVIMPTPSIPPPHQCTVLYRDKSSSLAGLPRGPIPPGKSLTCGEREIDTQLICYITQLSNLKKSTVTWADIWNCTYMYKWKFRYIKSCI